MSNTSNWSYTSKATIWHAISKDEFGDIIYSKPVHIMCDFTAGSAVSSSGNGIQNVAKNDIFTEYQNAKVDDYILLKEHSDSLEALGDRIQSVTEFNNIFDDSPNDFKIQTSA